MVNTCAREKITIISDKKIAYQPMLKKLVSHAEFAQVASRVAKKKKLASTNRKNKEDALFTLNDNIYRLTWICISLSITVQTRRIGYAAVSYNYL